MRSCLPFSMLRRTRWRLQVGVHVFFMASCLACSHSLLSVADEGEEQKIEVHEAYLRFTQLFDGEFSDFMAQTGCGSLDEMFEVLLPVLFLCDDASLRAERSRSHLQS